MKKLAQINYEGAESKTRDSVCCRAQIGMIKAFICGTLETEDYRKDFAVPNPNYHGRSRRYNKEELRNEDLKQ